MLLDLGKTKFKPQKFYVKEQQGHLHNSSQAFKGEWIPELIMEMQLCNSKLKTNLYEVILQINVTAKNN